MISVEKPGSPAEMVEHFGRKGMHWGIRKEYSTSTSTRSSSPVKGSDKFSKQQAASMNHVAGKMNKAYGFKIDEFVPLTERENKHYIAYVMAHGKGHNEIHVTDSPKLKEDLIKMQEMGWFVSSAKNRVIEANLTHEAAHGMFHSINMEGKGFVGRIKAKQPMESMRKKAWDKAAEQGIKDGDIKPRKGIRKLTTPLHEYQMAKKLSKYAESSVFIEEYEAELFTAYHWSPNPPKFVDTFMNSVHDDMGKKVQPFSGRKVSHAT